MAIGLTPKYVQEINIDNLDKEHFLIIATSAIEQQDWEITYVNESSIIAHTGFNWRSWNEMITITIEDNVAQIRSECTGSQIIDWGKNKKNVQTLIDNIDLISSQESPESLSEKYAGWEQKYIVNNDEESPFQQNVPFNTKSGFVITPLLIAINIVIFIIMIVSGVHFMQPDSQDLLMWGANFRPMTMEGEWWRLFTACFLHIGLVHLLLNMYALFYIGLILEPILGKVRFLSVYLISGVAASLTSLWWNDLTISAGASGAIFGMYGVFFALLTTNIVNKSMKKAFLMSISLFIIYNILNGLKPGSGIDNAAHIGGLVSGFLMGYALIPSIKKYNNNTIKLSTIGALLLALCITSYTVIQNIQPSDIVKYDKAMEQFVTMEAKAINVFQMPEDTPKEVLLQNIQDNGIRTWEEMKSLLDSCDSYNVPEPIKERNSTLKMYCDLRLKNYKLIYKAINEDTEQYNATIEENERMTEALIKKLSNPQTKK